MKIIADKHKQLNYHPLMIYFMLNPNVHEKYGEAINNLSKYNGFTRGIFNFRAIKRGTKFCEDLTNDLKATLKNYNVIVRLVDDEEGNYNYALGKMNFSQEPARFELSMQKFIIDVCEQNIENLNAQLHYFTGDSDESKENSDMISEMIQVFRDAIMMKGFRKGVWKKLVSPEDNMSKIQCMESLLCKLPPDILDLKESIYEKLPDQKRKDDFNKLMAYFEAKMDAPELQESDKYVQGTIDHSQSEEFSLDYNTRKKPGVRPNITITITKVTARTLKYETKKAWGMEIDIDGDVIPAYIGSTAAAMVYICTLLQQKMGSHLYRMVFKRSLPNKNSYVKRHKDVIWLEQVYKTLFPGAPNDFDCWYQEMQKNHCQFINQGKSESARKIKRYLYNYKDAIPFCVVETCKKEPTYFFIDIPSENIIVPKELEDLITFE
jgi:hypothetical protein